ncbi:type II secretion system GspH family protein [Massilia sp. IC2-477]|uniref:type II secretion system protein n=1 Tax=Massilia sp. IC2-477 TaxID=2887198 RepID=UPI001D0F7586|nr:type II secretion system protein [Massilia sp. IC2-477]MCC2954147.1 type II secretion system GspH family protein [Massilia sp. IC2-477]
MKSNRTGAWPRSREGGFTLIETTAVIAIMGTLAAAALPRMVGLTGEARYAALDNARGALASVATMAHAKFLINGQATQSFQDSAVTLAHGYPAASQATAEAAGLGAHYVVLAQAGAMTLVPRAIAGTPKAAHCFLIYEQASAARPVPRISLGDGASADTCA